MPNLALQTEPVLNEQLNMAEYEAAPNIFIYQGKVSTCSGSSGAIYWPEVYSGTADPAREYGTYLLPTRSNFGWRSLEPPVSRNIEGSIWVHGSLIEGYIITTPPLFGYYLPKELHLQIEPSAYRLLTPTLCEVISRILEMIRLEKDKGLPLQSSRLVVFAEPEARDDEEMVLQLTLICAADEAMLVWEKLSSRIETLKRELPLLEARMIDERVRLDIDWLG